MLSKLSAPLVLAVAAGMAPGGAQAQATLQVIISGGFHQSYRTVLPAFEKATGITVLTGSGASEGVGPKTIRYQLAHGVKTDVVILSREGLHKLMEDGRIEPGSDVGLASTPLAAAVRTGAPRPDISTPSQFRNALIAAGKVVMPGSTSGQFVRDKVFPTLDLPDHVKLTLVARSTESAEALRAGAADLAIGPASELVHEPGLDMIGILPKELQIVQTFTAAITQGAANPVNAKKLIDYLASDAPEVIQAIQANGMEPARGR